MEDKTYNGWSNYETWRVNLEIFDDFNPFEVFSNNIVQGNLEEYLKRYAEEIIFADCDDRKISSLMEDFARAFLQEVNWHEIAKHMIDEYSEVKA